MRMMVLGLAAASAACLIPAAPAEAQSFAGSGFSSGHGSGHDRFTGQFHRDGDHDRRDRRRHRGDVFLYPPEYQGNSAWASDSFNDWWHERPLRSTPRWVFSNQDCARRYWQGGGWRC